MITGGFGFELDLRTGRVRNFYMGRDGVQRWADNDQPIDGLGYDNDNPAPMPEKVETE